MFNSGKRGEAVELMHEMRKQCPQNIFFCTSAGVLERKMGNAEKARKLFKEALELNSRSVIALHVAVQSDFKQNLCPASRLWVRWRSR